VAAYLNDSIFSWCVQAGKQTALLNAYPPRYFDGIDSGKRLYSSIPQAVTDAGLRLFTNDDLMAGDALSADFTGKGWRDMLGFKDTQVMEPHQAGQKLYNMAMGYDFSFFEYWASDYAGHKQDMESAVAQMESFDGVLGGVIEMMKDERRRMKEELLVLITSDHGNMEDLSTRKHTAAMVPALVIGESAARERFTHGLKAVTDVAGAIWREVQGS